MFLKVVQVLGLFAGPLLFVLSYFASGTLVTGESGGQTIASSMLVFASIGIVIFYMFMFVVPTSFVLSKKENRRHFKCDNHIWKSILIANVAQSIICGLAIVLTVISL